MDGGPLMTLVYLDDGPSCIIYFTLASMLHGWTHDGGVAKKADYKDGCYKWPS